jgi:hypothetical protein
MENLRELTYESLTGRVGETFRDTEAGFELELIEVEDLTETAGGVPEGTRTPFSLIFRAPGEPLLAQSIRPLVHDELGDLPIFLVPIAREADGMRYQAVFS